MNQLLFLYNEFIDPDFNNNLRIPLEFVVFATIDGKMYRHFRNDSVFILPLNNNKLWGNSKIYGALYLCKDIDFYIDILDAYHICSCGKIKRNHIRDMMHRIEVEATPIYFNTLDELSRLKYKEGNSIKAITYFGNINHPKIKSRLATTKNYRVASGIYKETYKKLFWRLKDGL